MNYPNTPGFQAHSETSRQAAAKTDAATLRNTISKIIESHWYAGRTADEVSLEIGVEQSTCAARFRELELKGDIVKTKMTRKTRYDRSANVYLHKRFFKEEYGRASVKKSNKPVDIMVMEAEHKKFKDALERISCVKKSGELYSGGTPYIDPKADALIDIARKALYGEE